MLQRLALHVTQLSTESSRVQLVHAKTFTSKTASNNAKVAIVPAQPAPMHPNASPALLLKLQLSTPPNCVHALQLSIILGRNARPAVMFA